MTADERQARLERQRRARLREKRRRRRRRQMIRRMIALGAAILLIAAAAIAGVTAIRKGIKRNGEQAENGVENSAESSAENIMDNAAGVPDGASADSGSNSLPAESDQDESSAKSQLNQSGGILTGASRPFTAAAGTDTLHIGDTDVLSRHAILINEDTKTIVAEKDAYSMIYPASMTKILTVLVAAEHVANLDDTVTITQDITDYTYKNDCSVAGFAVGETVPVRDLFYGTILPSGADAALALAEYVAGSQEAFVDMMNEKLRDLGIGNTAHFTNCSGLYDSSHYCTTYDMALIIQAAVSNEWCRTVLSEHRYTTAPTAEHPEGIELSNWFLRKIEDKDCGGEVLCAKTGFVNQSGNCAASYEISASGTPYICVTADTYNSWRCIYDHVAMYKLYAK